jgi:hypothetical protein
VKHRSRKWELRRRDAEITAEQIGSSKTSLLPVNLGAIAGTCAVRAINFRPMVVDGALAPIEGGFELFVRCESYEQEELLDRFWAAPDGSDLPRRVRNKIRFTIAHELAHTLFYDRSSRVPRRKFAVDNPSTQRALEKACNRIAAIFLIPKSALRSYYGSADFRDPQTLARLADQALVAPSVAIMRLGEVDVGIQAPAILATVRRIEGEPIIDYVWRHYSLRNRFRGLAPGVPLRRIQPQDNSWGDLRIFGGYFDELAIDEHGAVRRETWLLRVASLPGHDLRSFVLSLVPNLSD